MRTTTTFAAAIAAVLVATGFGVWATSPTNARVPSTGQGIDPQLMMMNARPAPKSANNGVNSRSFRTKRDHTRPVPI